MYQGLNITMFKDLWLNRRHFRRMDILVNKRVDDGFVFVEVDESKVIYKGKRLRRFGLYGRRKFENLLIMANPERKIFFIYA